VTSRRDKVAIVTGGASGIGRALCGESARRGARVILRGVEKNKAIIVVTPLAKAVAVLTRISPTAAMWLWRRVFLSRVRALRGR